MSANRWDEIDPKLVPSICFNNNKKLFLNQQNPKSEDPKRIACAERFKKHIELATKN
jgi:hypothetical protein